VKLRPRLVFSRSQSVIMNGSVSLPKAKRTAGGYRVFTSEHLESAELIKKMQALGFSLEQIRRMLELKFTHGHSCQNVRDGLREKLRAVDQQIEDLRKFRKEISEALRTCERSLKVYEIWELLSGVGT